MATKVSTGLTGLAVSRHPHKTLKALYNNIIVQLQQIPQDAAYRRHTEKIINERLKIVESELDTAKLEKKINCGQVEEVIKQAERELYLVRKMLVWKPWEQLIGQAPPNQWKWPLA